MRTNDSCPQEKDSANLQIALTYSVGPIRTFAKLAIAAAQLL
jgi:hypothetical protein